MKSLRLLVSFVVSLSGNALVWAGEEKGKDEGVVDQIGTSVKSLATRIEKEITGVVKKIEESDTPKKVGNELKRSAESLGEKVEQAGRNVKESFKSD